MAGPVTAPETDGRRWVVEWATLAGTHRAEVLCTEHKRRHEAACVDLRLPRPASVLLAEDTAGGCLNCYSGRTIANRALFGRRRRSSR